MKLRALVFAFCAGAMALPLSAQEILPSFRSLVMADSDLAGGDIASQFDTNISSCERACQSNEQCEAFTFNTRNNSCFLKSGAPEQSFFQGAISAYKVATDPEFTAAAQTRKAELSFLSQSDLDAALALARTLGFDHPNRGRDLTDMMTEAQSAADYGDWTEALNLAGAATNGMDWADYWLDYGVLARRASENGDNRFYYQERAHSAFVNAYLRSLSNGQRHNILLEMARLYETRGQGRLMLSALRLAQKEQSREDTARWLEEATLRFGFRVTQEVVQSDLARPLVCVDFSEGLAQAGVDYADFIKAPAGAAVEISGNNRLCVTGLAHGERYPITLRKGLPSADGQALLKDVALSLYIRDRNPSAAFGGRGYVLPRGGAPALPVQTVNTEKLDLKLYKVTDRNLLRAIQENYFGSPMDIYSEDEFALQLGAQIWQGEAIVGQDLNRDVTTRLPLGEALDGQGAGIYVLRAAVPGSEPYEAAPAWQWFTLSDIGVTTMSGADGLHIFTRSLASADAIEGAEVELLNRANAVVARVKTDDQGYARFEAGQLRGQGAAAPGMVVLRQGDEDLTFLSLTDPEFDLSDRGVAGREAAGAIDVFMTTDRGAYRAGEKVYVTAMARDAQAQALEGLPLTAIITRPDGIEYSRQVVQDRGAGGYVFDITIGATAPRGSWSVKLLADLEAAPLARKSFLVEDFLPERIDFTLETAEKLSLADPSVALDVSAKYLFGAPAAGLTYEGEVVVSAAKGLKSWPGYVFGRHDQSFDPVWNNLPSGQTQEDGSAQIDLSWPDVDAKGQPLQAKIALRIAEGSGRPVERNLERELTPLTAMIGLKPEFDGVVRQGAEASFLVVGLGPDLQPQSMQADWTLTRIETDYQWYQSYGSWSWEPVSQRSKVDEGQISLGADPIRIASKVDWGQYELRVTAADGISSSTTFWAGWYAPADVSATPDTLELSLDKPAYGTGDTAVLRIVPRAAGTALVTVMSNELVAMKAVEVSEGENLIALDVTEDWGAGVYVSASVLRPMDIAAGRNPARALGLAYAAVDPAERALDVAIEAPAESDPRQPLQVAVKIGAPAGEQAYVTIAAIDQGILNLTGFKDPDPKGYYFGQRKLGMALRDLYGRLIDGLNGAQGEVRSGGDAGAQARLQAPPPTEELVAYFTGPVEVMEDGYARASFDLPAFNGTVRVMAVAWSKSAIGQASAEVLVRDPVVVTASLPRFMAPGDQSRLLLEVTHATGATGEMTLRAAAEGVTLGDIPAAITLGEKEKLIIEVPVQADSAGIHQINILLTTPDGKELTKTLTIPVQVNDPEIARVSQIDLAKGQSLILSPDLFDDMLPGTGRAVAAIGPFGRLNVPRLLADLDRYPYGCTEQVTSIALPLLYFSDLAKALDLKDAQNLTPRINDAIKAVLANQGSEGGFGLWGIGSGDLWLNAYISDFLSRARGLGYDVPDLALRNALAALRNDVNAYNQFNPSEPQAGAALAYALMVLAREGGAAIGDLRYFADVQGDDFATPLAQAQLGAALAYYGDQRRADMMFAKAGAKLEALSNSAPDQLWRADYGSHFRDAAGVLALALEAKSSAVNVEALTDRITSQGQHLSTQEAAWALMAAHALLGDKPEASLLTLRDGEGEASLLNSFGDTTARITLYGVPEAFEPAAGNGFAIDRRYYTLDGEEISLSEGVAMGERMVVVLEITPFGTERGRLMVADPLPAGFEIDNPNLISASTSQFSWLPAEVEAQHSEFRQDRFLTALEWEGSESFGLSYIVRAISPGDFRHPAASVEDMYRPERRAWTETSRVTVIAP